MNNENQLLEQKELREIHINRTDILDKVGSLLLLPRTEYATLKQVANYYEVPEDTIKSIVSRNIEELESDNYKIFNRQEVIEFLKLQNETLENKKGKSIVNLEDETLEIPNRGLRLFPKRAILRIGMLLRDSEIAKEVRSRLLDIIHDAEDNKTDNDNTIIENVVEEINEERQLILDRVEAEMSGDKNI